MKDEMNDEILNRRSVLQELKHWDIFDSGNDYIEVCEWTNREGYDITFSTDQGIQKVQVTDGMINALMYCYYKLMRFDNPKKKTEDSDED